MMFRKLTASVLLCSIFVVACGGGSPGGTPNTGTPNTGTPSGGGSNGWNINDVGNYFPFNENSKWAYWESDGSSAEFKKTKLVDVRLNSVERSSVMTLATFGERPNLDSLAIEHKIQKTESTLSTLVQTVPWLSQQEMVPDIDFTAKQGSTWLSFKKIGLEYPYDTDYDGKKEITDIEQSASFDGYENITTEAGDFKLAAKISTSNKLTYHLSRSGKTSSYITTRVRWFANGIGLVKDVTTSNAGTQSASVVTRELKAYSINERIVGFSFPFLVQDDVGTVNSYYEQVLSQMAIASNGNEFLLATTRQAGLYPYTQTISLGRLSHDFSSLGYTTIACSWQCGQPAMTFAADKYFLAYNCDGNISFQRFQANGQAIENTSIPVADRGISFQTNRDNPVVASSGQSYFVAYRLFDDYWGVERKPTGIYGAIISTDGKVLKRDILIRPFVSPMQSYSVAYGAGVYFLVFSNGDRSPIRCDDGCEDVLGVRISADGVVLDGNPILVSTSPDMQLDPRAVFDGTNFVVAWRDRRNYQSLTTGIVPLVTDIYATRVTPQGALLDGDAATGAVLLESNSTRKQMPSLLNTSRGVVLGWPSGTYSNSGDAPGIYLQLIDTIASLKTSEKYFVSGIPMDNSDRLGMFYSGVALTKSSDELIATWVDNSKPYSRNDGRGSRIIGVRAKLVSLPIRKP